MSRPPVKIVTQNPYEPLNKNLSGESWKKIVSDVSGTVQIINGDNVRITEDGENRITEDGQLRIIE
jgi:hypothetical protein